MILVHPTAAAPDDPRPRTARTARTARTEYDGTDAVVKTHQDLRTGGVGGGAIDATITTTHARDRNGRLTELTDARSNASTFEYDTLDRRTKLIYPEGETHLYTYNQASDLIAEADPNATEFSYTYDRLSRRTEVRVELVSPGSGVINTTGTDPVQTFAYDGLDRVTEAVDASASDTGAAAPHDDNRVTDYVHFRRQCVEERDPCGGETHDQNHLLRQYVWGDYIDELIQQREYHPGDPDWFRDYYLLSDLHYRAVALTDCCGGVVEGYETDAYGRTRIACDAFDAVRIPVPRCAHLFTGRYLDAETGLHYFRARHYHPALGRFMQRDPKGYEEGANLYEYVGSAPLGSFDPLGRESLGYWWDVVKNMPSGLGWTATAAGTDIRSAANAAADWGEEKAASTQITPVAAAAGFSASLTRTAGSIVGGIVDVPGTVDAVQEGYHRATEATGMVMHRAQSMGAGEATIWAEGTGYLINRLIGTAYIAEGVFNVDIATATEIGGAYERTLHINRGVGQASGLAAGGTLTLTQTSRFITQRILRAPRVGPKAGQRLVHLTDRQGAQGIRSEGQLRAYPKRADRAPRLLVIIELRGDGSPRQQKELKDERANPSQSFPGFR